MTRTLPLRFAQSLLRLTPMSREQLQLVLRELNLPLVIAEPTAVPDTKISVDDYGRLFIHLLHRLQDDMPSRTGAIESTLSFSAYRMMFQAMLHAHTLEQAMQRASVYFQRLQSSGDSFSLDIKGDQVCCRFDFAADNTRTLESPENFNLEELNWLPGVTGHVLSMAMWHRVCCWFIGSYIELSNVHMQQANITTQNDYADVFGTAVVFSSLDNAFYFHKRYLEFPIAKSESSLDAMLETYPAELFKIAPAEDSIATKVRQLIGTDFERDLPTLQDMAERLYMTTPTLHRRLRAEGTSFQQLKDSCRKDQAIHYLLSDNYNSRELAQLMGFSDNSTFHRAFKKWTGVTPQEFRHTHR